MMDATFLLLALVVFVAFAGQALSGFGASVVAVALGAHLYSIGELLPVLVPLTLLSAGWIAARHRADIDRDLLLRRILPLMGIGVAAGLAMFRYVDGPGLKRAYGVLVAVFAAIDLLRARDAVNPPSRHEGSGTPAGAATEATTAARTAPWLLAAGVVHGIYATGGPLLVLGVSRSRLDARASRSTLAAVWFVLNLATTATYAATGRLGATALPRIAWLVPVVALAVAAGEWAHARVSDRGFRRVTCALLLLAGATLLT